jgi:hypothetical protein
MGMNTGAEMGVGIGAEMVTTERKVKLTAAELRTKLKELQSGIKALLNSNKPVPIEQNEAYYNTFCQYLEVAPRPDTELSDQERSEFASLFAQAKRAVDVDHQHAHFKEYH